MGETTSNVMWRERYNASHSIRFHNISESDSTGTIYFHDISESNIIVAFISVDEDVNRMLVIPTQIYPVMAAQVVDHAHCEPILQ